MKIIKTTAKRKKSGLYEVSLDVDSEVKEIEVVIIFSSKDINADSFKKDKKKNSQPKI